MKYDVVHDPEFFTGRQWQVKVSGTVLSAHEHEDQARLVASVLELSDEMDTSEYEHERTVAYIQAHINLALAQHAIHEYDEGNR